MKIAFRCSLTRPALERFVPLVLLLAAMNCGGGGSSSGSGRGSSQSPNFSLTVSPTSQTIAAGNQASISLAATPAGSFTSKVGVQITGLPAGVSLSPTTITLTPGTPQQVTLSAATNAATTTHEITFSGSSGSLTHTAQLSLSVKGLSPPPAGRTKYLRSDGATEYYSWLNSHWIIFNAPTSRFFSADPGSNHVFVFDSVSETEIGALIVPGAYAIGDSPDHTTLYVGTLIGDVYTIDPVTMSVTNRYVASEIGPYGFSGLVALGLSNGDVALLGAAGGIQSVDGSPGFAVWNPGTNNITIYATEYGSDFFSAPYTLVCGTLMGNIAGFTLTADRSKVIVGSIDSDGTLCEVDTTSGADVFATAQGFSLNHILTSPDGNYIVLPDYPGNVDIYSAQTLSKLAVFSVNGEVDSASGFAISADSKTLFVPDDSDDVINAYSLDTHQQVGWLPGVCMNTTSSGNAVGPINAPFLLAVDGTGLFAGPLEEGLGFVDSPMMRTGPVGTKFAAASLNPATGPAAGGTQTQWPAANPMGDLAGAYFDGSSASDVSVSQGTVPSQDQIVATSPSGASGPVDVYAFTTDGGMQLLPEAFSYGPTIVEVTPNMATAEGGGAAIIYGYGFGPVGSNTSVPSGLQVALGGKTAQITGYEPNAYKQSGPPFPLQAVAYSVPPGQTASVGVTATTNAGSTTSRNAFAYLPGIKQFPLAGAALAQGVYDSLRDVYYFTDTNKIQVFSRTQGAWLTPVSIPGPTGATQRLWGLALSPDGSKLAIGDISAQVIYVVDPSNWSAVQTFSVPTMPAYSGVITNAVGVAISDAGIVYYAAYVRGADDFDQFFKLDTSTGVVTAYPNLNGPSLPATDIYLRTVMSKDNSQVFFNMLGYVFYVDTATDNIHSASVDPGCCYGNYDLTLAGNGEQFEASSYLYDANLNAESYYAFNDREVLNVTYVYGTKLNADGTMLFQPSTVGVDVLDGRLGNLLARISLPVALSQNYDALVADGKDSVLVAITGVNGDGIAVVDLSSIPEPPALPYNRQFRRWETAPIEAAVRSDRESGIPMKSRRQAVPPAARSLSIPHLTRQALGQKSDSR